MKFNKVYFATIVLALAICSFPLYIFPSGMPQPSHLLMLISFLLAAKLVIKKSLNKQIVILLLVIVVYVTIRQFTYGITTNNFDKIIFFSPLYFLFNTLLFATTLVFSIYVGKIENYIKYGVIFSLILTIVGIFYFGFSLQSDTSGEHAYRTIGTFNNPNQLGYYSVCIGGIISLLYINKSITLKLFSIMLIAVLFLAVLSLSKAAMVGIIFYLLLFFRGIKSVFIVGIIGLIGAISLDNSELDNYKFIQRLTQIGSDSDDNLEHRGYGALYNSDLRIIYGWGEGFTYRGHEGGGIGGHYGEVHSTLGGMLISYGFFGLLLFVYFLSKIFWKSKNAFGLVVSLALFIPIMLYGLTHNGIRFSVFWIYLGLVYGFSVRKIRQNVQS